MRAHVFGTSVASSSSPPDCSMTPSTYNASSRSVGSSIFRPSHVAAMWCHSPSSIASWEIDDAAFAPQEYHEPFAAASPCELDDGAAGVGGEADEWVPARKPTRFKTTRPSSGASCARELRQQQNHATGSAVKTSQ